MNSEKWFKAETSFFNFKYYYATIFVSFSVKYRGYEEILPSFIHFLHFLKKIYPLLYFVQKMPKIEYNR